MYVACVKTIVGSKPTFFFGENESSVRKELIAFIEASTGESLSKAEGFFPDKLGLEFVEMGVALECK